MIPILDSKEYLDRLLALDRPGVDGVGAFYEHRVGAICKDPKMMLLPWDDHLVHRGDGVFETFMFRNRRIYQMDAHLARLERSAKSIYLDLPCPLEEIRERIIDVARAGGVSDGNIRLLLGRGPGGFGIDVRECPQPSLYIAAYGLKLLTEEAYAKGATAIRSSIPAKQSYIAKIKSLNYLPNMLIKREAWQKGVDYALCFNDEGYLAEGAIENACIVDATGTLVAPEFSNALRGTTLLRAMELLKDEMPVAVRPIREDEIYAARELMVVGTTIGAFGVVRFNDKPIHDARPGPVSRRIREVLDKDHQENGIPF